MSQPVVVMSPLDIERAAEFWASALGSASRGERIVLVAEELATNDLVGTVQVILAAPENQPHRGEISKMLVSRATVSTVASDGSRWGSSPTTHCGPTAVSSTRPSSTSR